MVLCEGFRDALCKSGYSAEKIRMIRRPINVDNIHPTEGKHTFRQRFGIAEDSFIVLWAGSMGIKQGLSNIVEACKLLQVADVYHGMTRDGISVYIKITDFTDGRPPVIQFKAK